jgi:hypothetical protein
MVMQETALRRAGKMIFDECLWTTQPAGRPLDRLPLGSPKGVSLAGAGESLLDRTGSWEASGRPALEGPARGETSGRERANASTEATLSCASTVEFPKKSIFKKRLQRTK